MDGIRITTEVSATSFTLLDITFTKGKLWEATRKEDVGGGFLDTSVYQKPLNVYQYFPFRSAHPRHCKRGFIIGELYRYLLRESSEEGFQQMKSSFAVRLRARGYQSNFIQQIFDEVQYSDRETLLQRSEKGRQRDGRVLPFVLEYHPSLEHPQMSHVAESASVCPPSVGGECALSTDVLEDRKEEFQCFAAALPHLVSTLLAPEGDPDAPDILTPRSYAEAIEGPYSSQWQAAMDTEMASWKSTGTYVDEVPPPGANIVSGMWIFRVKQPPGSPPVFKARYVARGFRQRQGVDYFQTFSPTPKMTTLRVLLHVAA
ncbi:unnamed protein product [Closterium sp. NIES-53]